MGFADVGGGGRVAVCSGHSVRLDAGRPYVWRMVRGDLNEDGVGRTVATILLAPIAVVLFVGVIVWRGGGGFGR